MKHVYALLKRHPALLIGGGLLLLIVCVAIFAPWLGTVDPTAVSPINRTKLPSEQFWFGTDMLGRDVYSRVIYGSRVSLIVGFSVAFLSVVIGVVVALIAGFVRTADAIIMRIVDGLMSIPHILLAIALIAVSGSSITNVIVALTIAEIPQVVRLERGMVLSLREMPYVEAAIASGAGLWRIVGRHIFPNTVAALLVQATYICSVAILLEASLSFIGAGVPPTTPSWGNIMAEGRTLWQIRPNLIAFPAIFLSLTVLAVNMLGDSLSDLANPRANKGGK
ncbi:MAG: ABC transporter permease [Candidimonas sp.]|nr:MAG: ABC transporter permease [Candidimonas sp.]